MVQTTIPVFLVGALVFFIIVIRDTLSKKKKPKSGRLFFYSFIVYCAVVAQLTFGSLAFPPFNDAPLRIQLQPFYFIQEWSTYNEFDGYPFFNNARLTLFNFLMLMPLGFYLAYLFEVKKMWKAAAFLFSTSLLIETTQLVLSYFGFVWMRGFNTDDLIMNTLGGLLVFVVCWLIKRKKKRKKQSDAA
ncbi:VanZ family protein [Jeotgalibacillus proteolyticus]|uniref:VanZ family protein n=1 Tax=Jeotgalibacillus proteolyticus TaxID=2082395 RepID=A0A2S5GA78_9BACL|nr:VanZ family protein [Jeotgalibacillus proteolyticus]PPA69896.1 VanZ family protein [Jeotgalibacillus proteolyticus]